MTRRLRLFEAFGVELEYMIVDAQSLSVRAITDQVLHAVAGRYESEVELGAISWSNELALHVIELKTTGPSPSLETLPELFQQHVRQINGLLAPLGARLMPSAMHPWMDPWQEMKLWPHDYSPVYTAFDRIFDCRGHGWANLQSVHLNLPFADDEEFGALHAAIRLVLPILPAIAASSPIFEQRVSGLLDSRLDVYRGNARRIPSISGQVVPEPIFSHEAYQREILERLYRDIAPHDPKGTLQHEWLNARGAIARFDRSAIEIRVLDVQECPLADVAICQLTRKVLEALVAQRWTDRASQQAWATQPLADLLFATVKDAEQTLIDNAAYLQAFGMPAARATAGELWQHLAEATAALPNQESPQPWQQALQVILQRGPLARRILQAAGPTPQPEQIQEVYRHLCDSLKQGELFQ